jgi:hypothetical protein
MNLIHLFEEMVITLEEFQLNILLKLKNQEWEIGLWKQLLSMVKKVESNEITSKSSDVLENYLEAITIL